MQEFLDTLIGTEWFLFREGSHALPVDICGKVKYNGAIRYSGTVKEGGLHEGQEIL